MRASGILMPVFSLPGPYGIGTLGGEAFAFVDFLAAAKQTYWQILPIGPTGYGDSPYQSFSAFAGNPYFIDYRLLAADGLLTEDELPSPQSAERIDYGALYQQRPVVLRKAAERLLAAGERRMRTLLAQVDTTELPAPDGAQFRNLNTPEELWKMEKEFYKIIKKND